SSYLFYFSVLIIFFILLQKIMLNTNLKINRFYIFSILLFCLVLSDFFIKMFFPSEIIGVTLVLAAIIFLSKQNTIFYFLGFLCCHIAGQTKEVFVFAAFAIAIYLILQGINTIKVIFLFSSSLVLVLFIEYLFLMRIKAVGSYLEIIEFKSEIFKFNLEVTLIKLPIKFLLSYLDNYTLAGLMTPLIIVIVSLIQWRITRRNEKFANLGNLSLKFIASINLNCLLAISIFFGMLWQGAGFGEHYALALMPFIIIVIYHLLIASYSKHKLIAIITCWFLLIPSVDILNLTSRQIFKNFNNISMSFPKIISEQETDQFQLAVKRCLQVAYGWNPGVYYFYNKINPCSRFYLANHLIADKDLAIKFRKDLVENPPSEIIYQTARSGIDFELFEKTVFPYPLIISNCYVKSEIPNLYIQKFNENKKLVNCIQNALKNML
ncbi:MAG: hypothetical protein RLZ10_925, partial [Bacteroidota bacterium]